MILPLFPGRSPYLVMAHPLPGDSHRQLRSVWEALEPGLPDSKASKHSWTLCTQFQSACLPHPVSCGLKHGAPSKVALVRPNNRPISLLGVRAHADPATEAETRQQDLSQRKPGRVVSIPVPKLTQALPCVAAFPCPLPWTDSPFSVSASTGPSLPLQTSKP